MARDSFRPRQKSSFAPPTPRRCDIGKRKIREKKSKLSGTKAILEQLNTEAHKQLHEQVIGSGAPTIGSFGASLKWADQ